MTLTQEIEYVAERIPRYGLSPASRKQFIKMLVDARCAHCGRRMPIDERSTLKVAGRHRMFHTDCAEVGAIQLRADAAAAHTPAARRRLADAKTSLARAKRG